MRLSGAFLASALLLAACGGGESSTDTAITPELLENPAAVERIANRLEPADRAGFSLYVAHRRHVANTGAPPLVHPDGSDPATVAEAAAIGRWLVDLDRERELAVAPYEPIMVAAGEGVSAEKYAEAQREYSKALAAYDAKRAAGPPAAKR